MWAGRLTVGAFKDQAKQVAIRFSVNRTVNRRVKGLVAVWARQCGGVCVRHRSRSKTMERNSACDSHHTPEK